MMEGNGQVKKINDGLKWAGERMDEVGQAFSNTVSFINPLIN